MNKNKKIIHQTMTTYQNVQKYETFKKMYQGLKNLLKYVKKKKYMNFNFKILKLHETPFLLHFKTPENVKMDRNV